MSASLKALSESLYHYEPSHVLPAVFAALVGASLLLHIYQNFRYKFWRVTFFMAWGGAVFTTGWILRAIASYNTSDANLYIAQTVFILAGPPIYSAAEYNILGRLMHYVPMHAPLNPNRLVYFFIYCGAAVEGLTAAGGSLVATAAASDSDKQTNGGRLISIALVLQAVVEFIFIGMVALMHYRCARSKMLPRNIRSLCIMLYGTSTLVIIRCICRAIESFRTHSVTTCDSVCRTILNHEWYLYAFEAAPMLLYTIWLNIIHPGRLLPKSKERYLDIDGKTERLGPGWSDRRSTWATFVDPFDLSGLMNGTLSHEGFWLRPDDWKVAPDGSFALGTAKNVRYERSAEIDASEK